MIIFEHKEVIMNNRDKYLNDLFNELSNKISELVELKANEVEFLYHYTELNGFLGIFQTGNLWASNAFFLNDSSEVKYGLELSRDFFEKYSYFWDKFYKSQNIFHSFSRTILGSNLFFVSFCENGDLLSQWRGYSQNSEVISLRFNAQILKSLSNITLHKVIYDENIQTKIIDYFLECFCIMKDYFNKHNIYSIHYVGYWINKFRRLIATFKDKSFSEENEWRLIYDHSDCDNKKNIYFRKKNNYILPYVEIDEINVSTLINQVIVGPSSNNTLSGKSIEYFFGTGKYSIEIIYSKIPFRK
jgi:hypothetical protein